MGWVRTHPTVVSIGLVVGFALGGIQAVRAEVDARKAADCTQALEFRTEQRDMWMRVLRRAGVDEPTIDILRDGYADLPTPASCT